MNIEAFMLSSKEIIWCQKIIIKVRERMNTDSPPTVCLAAAPLSLHSLTPSVITDIQVFSPVHCKDPLASRFVNVVAAEGRVHAGRVGTYNLDLTHITVFILSLIRDLFLTCNIIGSNILKCIFIVNCTINNIDDG